MRFGMVGFGRMGAALCRQALDAGLSRLLKAGHVIVGGGNWFWRDAERRHAELADRGVRFLHVGTSGGISGTRHGACFMAGGDADAFQLIRPLLVELAVDERAVIHAGGPGSGHFSSSSTAPSS